MDQDYNYDDDFSVDNNPFAGSNHYFSNGILEQHQIEKNQKDNTNIFDDYNNESENEELEIHQSNDNNNDKNDNNNNNNNNNGDDDDDDYNDGDDNYNDNYDIGNTTNESLPYSVSEQPSLYAPILNIPIINKNQSSSISIKTFEILKDFKNTKTVYYKIENNLNNTFVLRRYNDFKSLRSYLCKFYPYLFIPPIPEKHSLSRFLKNPFNYKNDLSIIQLRIRLLNYFLLKLNQNEILSKSSILNKFLDPLINNWLSCLNSPPFTNLSSKSILLISTKNPTKPSPYFSYLPIPPLNLLKNFNSNLNNKIFQNLEFKLKYFLKISINLEIKIKNLIKLLDNLRVNLVEFGGFLNIFSIIENQNFKIEKFGNKIDLNFLNIEILINNLIIKIKEPIIILKNSLIYLIHMLHFRKLKELQLQYFQNIILRKQSKLKSLINSINSSSINNLNNDIISKSPSLKIAIENLKLKDKNQKIQIDNLPNESKQFILNQIKSLNNELNSNLIPCFNILADDVKFLSINVENNVNSEFKILLNLLLNLNENWKSNVWGEYLISCLKIWHDNQLSREAIQN
jgi:hypothetical protein